MLFYLSAAGLHSLTGRQNQTQKKQVLNHLYVLLMKSPTKAQLSVLVVYMWAFCFLSITQRLCFRLLLHVARLHAALCHLKANLILLEARAGSSTGKLSDKQAYALEALSLSYLAYELPIRQEEEACARITVVYHEFVSFIFCCFVLFLAVFFIVNRQ